MAPWSDLPSDLLGLVIARLPFPADRARFRALATLYKPTRVAQMNKNKTPNQYGHHGLISTYKAVGSLQPPVTSGGRTGAGAPAAAATTSLLRAAEKKSVTEKTIC
ncbi:hypothetical protein OsI_26106 [Oryza sativa Indica Group]|uniref:F-box domain-containing protein n=1 Tax=Oryza sativa subsp. indica TaxID=39946 RepID=A2YLK8_ORYSI|nr:hypothetical protein OsI_26106 [Oryza sativa Indica Group]